MCAHISIRTTVRSTWGKGRCAACEANDGVDETEEVTTSGSDASVGRSKLPSASSSSSFSSSSSSLSTHPLLAPPLQSELDYKLHANAFTTRHSVDPFAPPMEKEAEARTGPWEGCDDMDLLSLTFGESSEGGAYRAMPPLIADEEVAVEMVISDEDEDEEVCGEEPGGYLRRGA